MYNEGDPALPPRSAGTDLQCAALALVPLRFLCRLFGAVGKVLGESQCSVYRFRYSGLGISVSNPPLLVIATDIWKGKASDTMSGGVAGKLPGKCGGETGVRRTGTRVWKCDHDQDGNILAPSFSSSNSYQDASKFDPKIR